MTPSAPLPVGVVGVGALGRHHARHLRQLEDAHLVGVYDLDAGRGRQVAEEIGVRAFADLDALLDAVEAVTVAVPTRAHADVGTRALERGIAVLMEKPLAASLPEADALIGTAGHRGVPLLVGHIERFNRALRAARPFLDEPRFLESTRLAPFQPRGTDVAVVLDLMIHDLDLMLSLTGGAPVTDVRANGVAVLSPHLDAAQARVEFASGAVATVSASRLSRERVRSLRIWQQSGYFSLDLGSGAADFMRVRPDWLPGTGNRLEDVVEMRRLEAPEADALGLELGSFVRAVRLQGAVDPKETVSGREGRAALALALRVAEAIHAQPALEPNP